MASFEALRREIAALDRVGGISPDEVVTLPEDLHAAFRKMLKGAITLDELALELGVAEGEAREIGQLLVEKGFLQKEDFDPAAIRYRVRFARMRTRNIPLDL